MPSRTGKITGKKILNRHLSPEIPFPEKVIESNNDDIENQMPIDETESKHDEISPIKSDENTNHPMSILLANGQPLLTNFEEKYLIDFILRSTNKDIEKILEEKIHFILEMNYGLKTSGFKLNSSWIYDFILKHFQSLMNHMNSQELFDYILKKNFDKNNSVISFKYWQLQTLINEHSKKIQQTSTSQQRRMTVRRLNLN